MAFPRYLMVTEAVESIRRILTVTHQVENEPTHGDKDRLRPLPSLLSQRILYDIFMTSLQLLKQIRTTLLGSQHTLLLPPSLNRRMITRH